MSTPDRLRDFAPISSGPSTRLRLVAGYFTLSGILALAFTLMAVAAVLLGKPPGLRSQVRAHPVLPLVNFAVAALMVAVGELLRRRSRLGGVLALVAFAPPLVARALGRPVTTLTLILSAVGALLVLSVWRELHPIEARARRAAGD